jgi:hypothetical protein
MAAQGRRARLCHRPPSGNVSLNVCHLYPRSICNPETMAPLYIHSGPEAFYVVDGDTRLETPDGVPI